MNMAYTYEEIELTLRMYSIAKQHLYEMNTQKAIGNQNEIDNESIYCFYAYIVHLVDSWIKQLFPDEILILKMRIFDKKTFDYISIQIGYANHSSVIRKYKDIITKIKNMEN